MNRRNLYTSTTSYIRTIYQKGNISIISTKIIGNALYLDNGPSYAVVLKSINVLHMSVKGSSIQQTNEGVSLTIKHGTYFIEIDSTIFSDNVGQCFITTFNDVVNVTKSYVHIQNVEFIKNSGIFASAITLVTNQEEEIPKLIAYVRDCTFYSNQADTFFGAIYADRVHLIVSDSFFANNLVGEIHGSIQGFGGAIYVETSTIVTVKNTIFINNTCSGFGGTIFSRGTFSCINCSFTGASGIVIRPLLGDIIYATAGLSLINTTWVSTVMSEVPKALIWHPGSPTIEEWKITVAGYFEATCPVGHNITHSGIEREENKLTSRMSMSCKPMPPE